MDELELLKQYWNKNKQRANYPRLSYNQIYNMLLKRSSSIVKWIFVISIIEFLFGSILGLFLIDKEMYANMESLHLTNFFIAAEVITIPITIYFIYSFYRNYKNISATDNAVTLMNNILKTRRTVKNYISFILISIAFITITSMIIVISYHTNSTEVADISNYTFTNTQWLIFIGMVLIFLIIFLGVIRLFYGVLYGFLLRKLNSNYQELKKIEL